MAKNFKRKNAKTDNRRKNTKMVLSNLNMTYPPNNGLGEDELRSIVNEMTDTLSTIPFNRISIPLNAKRSDILGVEDTRYITIGFIRNYNPETEEFSVTILDKYKEAISKFEDPMIEVNFGHYNNSFTKINKISLIDAANLNMAAE